MNYQCNARGNKENVEKKSGKDDVIKECENGAGKGKEKEAASTEHRAESRAPRAKSSEKGAERRGKIYRREQRAEAESIRPRRECKSS